MSQKLDASRFYPQVLQVIPTDDYQVYAYLNDGSVRLFDARPLIKENTVFESLKDIHVFKSKLSVINGTIAWDMGGGRDAHTCLDIDPFVVFAQERVADPLEGGKI